MTKAQLLKELSALLASGKVSRHDIEEVLDAAGGKKGMDRSSVAKIFYILGAAIVVLGVIFFVSQIWYDIGSFGRIGVTLGMGLVFAAIGSSLYTQRPKEVIGSVFHAIGGLLIPSGAMVSLSEFRVVDATLWPIATTFAIIFVFYGALNSVYRRAILTFYAIGNATVAIYTTTGAILDSTYYPDWDVFAYLTMLIGISYLLLAHASERSWNKHLVSLLNFAGIVALLGAAFSQVVQEFTWLLLYFPLLAGTYTLAVYTKRRSILIVSTLFLIIHMSYITSEYFADSIGWPVALVFLGLLIIALGYGSLEISQRYIRTQNK